MPLMSAGQTYEPAPHDVLAYYGHHKCASTWIDGIMHSVVDEIGLEYVGVHDVLTPSAVGLLAETPDTPVRFERSDLRDYVDRRGAQFVTCHTADRLQADILNPSRAFHVIRDPRDIIVSAYFSHRDSHATALWPRLEKHREALRAVPESEGLHLEMAFSAVELQQIGDWNYKNEAVLELKMEELIAHPYDGFVRIFRHLGLLLDEEPVRSTEQLRVFMTRLLNRFAKRRSLGRIARSMPATGEIVLGAVYAQRFETQTRGRARGVEDTTSHYRKGIAGDWLNHFKREHAEAFNGRFGDLLVRLGYEDSAEWFDR